MKLIWGLALGAMLLAVPAKADTLYDVAGTVTLTGNSVCNGQPCVETINLSLVLDEYVDQFGFYNLTVENPTENQTGPLQPFSGAGIGGGFYLGLALGTSAAIDIPLTSSDDLATPFAPSFASFATLYSCGGLGGPVDQTCVTDFSLNGLSCCDVGGGTASLNVTEASGNVPTPEPRTLTMLAFGLLALGGLTIYKKYRVPDIARSILRVS